MSAPVKFSIITNYLSAILVLLVTLYLSSQIELWEEIGVQFWLGALVRPLQRNFFSDSKCFFFLSGQLEFSQFKLKDVIHRKKRLFVFTTKQQQQQQQRISFCSSSP